MTDRKVSVSVCSAAAWGLWGAAILLLGASWVWESLHMGLIGLAVSALAGTATVRSYFVSQTDLMHAAYNLGRESAGGSVRPLG